MTSEEAIRIVKVLKGLMPVMTEGQGVELVATLTRLDDPEAVMARLKAYASTQTQFSFAGAMSAARGSIDLAARTRADLEREREVARQVQGEVKTAGEIVDALTDDELERHKNAVLAELGGPLADRKRKHDPRQDPYLRRMIAARVQMEGV